jgi:hypothetical protein
MRFVSFWLTVLFRSAEERLPTRVFSDQQNGSIFCTVLEVETDGGRKQHPLPTAEVHCAKRGALGGHGCGEPDFISFW